MQAFEVGMQVQMRKKHPCGSDKWQIYRLGADIGLQCLGCGRRVLLARTVFNKSMKKIISATTRDNGGGF
jgi:hypothetical protein